MKFVTIDQISFIRQALNVLGSPTMDAKALRSVEMLVTLRPINGSALESKARNAFINLPNSTNMSLHSTNGVMSAEGNLWMTQEELDEFEAFLNKVEGRIDHEIEEKVTESVGD